jgi:MFS family permease
MASMSNNTSNSETHPTTAKNAGKTPSKSYRHYALFMLGLTYAFSLMDRQIVSILLGDLKSEFQLNDTQLGLLSGLAFALLYSALAIPIARYADRHNRASIISLAVAVWSLITALTAFATNFTQLLLARIGVSVGEAGGLSPAHSLISDYYDFHERSMAIALFSMGAPFGAMMGLLVGGHIGEQYGWRMALLVAGIPGLLLALAVKLTVKEPRRGHFDKGYHEPDKAEPFWATVKLLFSNPPFRLVLIGHTLVVFAGYAILSWLPQVFLRSYEVSQSEVGSAFGVIYFLGAGGGMLAGGILATHFSKRDPRWQLRLPIIGLTIATPLFWLALSQEQFTVSVSIVGVALFLYSMQHGPSLAVVQSVVRPDHRATAASINFFAANFFGLGLGPLAVGVISDWATPSFCDDALAFAVAIAVVTFLPGVLFLYRASSYLRNR